MLEQLPAIDPSLRRDRAVQIAGQSRDVPDEMAAGLINKLLTLIDLPEFAPLFGKDALVEVPINGRLNGIGIAGQIDRLFVDDKRIILADFKTGRPHEKQYRETIFIKWRFMMAFFRKSILGETLIVGLFGLIRLIISRLIVTPESRHWLIFLPLMTLCARQIDKYS